MTEDIYLAQLRWDAESTMVDAVTITRPGEPVTDDSGDVSTTGPTVYSGRAKIQARDSQESDRESAGASLTIRRYEVHVPVARASDDYSPSVGDLVTVSNAANDPHLAGQQFRVVGLPNKTHATAYRLAVTRDETQEAA